MRIYNFTFTKLVTTPVCDGYVKLDEDLKIWVNNRQYLIKAGFVANFRSKGKLSNLFLPKVSNEVKAIAYVLHDALYTTGYRRNYNSMMFGTKGFADKLLISMLKWDNGTLQRLIAYNKSLYDSGLKDKQQFREVTKKLNGDILTWFDLKIIEWALKLFGGLFYGKKLKYPKNENWNKVLTFSSCV